MWSGEGVVLGHRRLAILDLDARANQPMVSADGRYAIVFNGEIYNFRELRRALEQTGRRLPHDFRHRSPARAVRAARAQRMLPRLRGMFAFAIWDTQARELFLARDPYGIKPLYYAPTKDGLALRLAGQGAARIGAGLDGPRAGRDWRASISGAACPSHGRCIRDMFALPAGHWLRVRAVYRRRRCAGTTSVCTGKRAAPNVHG